MRTIVGCDFGGGAVEGVINKRGKKE
jgi:hypothetical protein